MKYDYVDFTQLESMNKEDTYVDVLAVIQVSWCTMASLFSARHAPLYVCTSVTHCKNWHEKDNAHSLNT